MWGEGWGFICVVGQQKHGQRVRGEWRKTPEVVKSDETCNSCTSLRESLGVQLVSSCRRPWFHSWLGKIPWRRDRLPTPVFMGFPGGSDGKEPTSNVGHLVQSLCWEDPTPIFLPGEFHGQRSLAGYNPWGHKESDTTERLSVRSISIWPSLLTFRLSAAPRQASFSRLLLSSHKVEVSDHLCAHLVKFYFYFALYRSVTLLLSVFTSKPRVLELRRGQTVDLWTHWASLVAELVEHPPAMRETWVLSLAWEDPLETGMAIHSSILARRIPWTVESLGSHWSSGATIPCISGYLMPLDNKEIQPVHPKGNQSWVFIGGSDVEAETPILWPPNAKNLLIGKDPDAGKDWRQEKKGTTEDEMVGWHHWLNGHEFE